MKKIPIHGENLEDLRKYIDKAHSFILENTTTPDEKQYVSKYKDFKIYYSPETDNFYAIKIEIESQSKNGMSKGLKIFLIISAILVVLAGIGGSNNNTVVDDSKNEIESIVADYIKNNMKNPDSFELVTETSDKLDNGSIVYITYRGTNSFNAIVTENKTVYLDEYNNILSID